MSARTMWKGVVRCGPCDVPVRLYAAAKDHSVHFRLLHKTDRVPVQQRLVHPETGAEVPGEQRRKGVELEPGLFVLLDQEDLDELEPPPSRTIEIKRFIPRAQLDHEWYDRPYFLGPDDPQDAYWALLDVLAESGREGIARWVMRKKEYAGSIFVHQGYLALASLRFAQQVVQPEELELPSGPKLNQAEVQMAEQLTGMLESDFDAGRYRDEFHDRVLQMIEAKAKGARMAPEKAAPKKQAASLSDALRASLAQAGKSKGGR